MSREWTTPNDVAARVRRRWNDGTLLRDYALGAVFEPIEVAVNGPAASQIGDDLGAVREWVAQWDAGRKDDSRYALRWRAVGGRRIGRNELPARAVVSSFEQAWALLGVRDAVRRFDDVLRLTAEHPAARAWAVAQPHRALELRDDMARLLAAYEWLDAHRGSGRYLREITAPGVDTKFAEQHRAVLGPLLGVSSKASDFVAELGLASKPQLVRLRPDPALRLLGGATEVAVRASELPELGAAPVSVLVVENEITYLSAPVPRGGAVVWGQGFDVDRLGRAGWIADAEVAYWGDLDTHGFAILDRLRAWLPQARSILMDRETLLAHRDRWGREDRPTRAALTRLTLAERELYEDLVVDALGAGVRLEQERIDWAWASERFGFRHLP